MTSLIFNFLNPNKGSLSYNKTNEIKSKYFQNLMALIESSYFISGSYEI